MLQIQMIFLFINILGHFNYLINFLNLWYIVSQVEFI